MPIPAPSDNPEVWDTVTLGPGDLPPNPREGTATLKVQPKAKLDTKRKGGAQKPTTTNTGRELAEVTITVRFTEALWPDMEAAIERLQPGSGPHKIGHPKCRLAKINAVSIESYEGPDWDEFQVGTIVWHCKEWAPPPPAEVAAKKPDAVQTPSTAVPYENQPWHEVKPGSTVAHKGVGALFAAAAAKAAAGANRP